MGGNDAGGVSTGGTDTGGTDTGGVGTGGGDAGRAGRGMGGAGGRVCAPPVPDVCDDSRCPSALPEEATTCAPDGNECGCNDLACPTSPTSPPVRCIRVVIPAMIGFGNPYTTVNRCVSGVCGGDADCSGGARCIRSRYGIPVCSQACRYDSECALDCGGRCAPLQIPINGGMQADYSEARCSYEGACSAESCAGCSNSGVGGAPSLPGNFHGCPG
jgi:hypothetical protein